jgi:putative phage-type endonuclease
MKTPLVVGNIDRQKYIGGSDVAAILGISPWKTALDVYLDKTTPRKEETDPGKQRVFNRGKRMEPYVIDLLAEETGLKIARRGERYRDQEFDFIAAEIDAEAESGENIEIKTVSPFKAKEWGEQQTDEIPVHYAAQAMHGLMVTGKDTCVFGVLIGGDDFRIYRIERDNETIAGIRKKEVDFWHCIVNGTVPEPTNAHDVIRLFGADAGTAVEANDSLQADIVALKSLKDEAKQLNGRIEACEERIKMYMRDAATLTMNGMPVCTWKTQTTRRFDQSAFKAAHPDLAEQFVKTSSVRVFRIK